MVQAFQVGGGYFYSEPKDTCSHGNTLDCPQCDSDHQQEVASEYLKDDQIPDCVDDQDAEYEKWLSYFDCNPTDQEHVEDDPDGGLEDYYGIGDMSYPADLV